MDGNEKYKHIEGIFNIYIQLNDYILKKSGSEELTLIDHYMFQATSYLISIIHNNLLIREESFCNCFIYRSLIEVITILKMYLSGEISEDSNELINNYNYIVEYNIYKKYKDSLDKKEFDFNQIENNFKKAKLLYRNELSDMNSKEFKNILNSKLPFLKEEFTFDELIKKYCEGFYQYYRILSVMIHPNDIVLTVNYLKDLDFEVLEANIHLVILETINKYYASIILNSTKTLRQEIGLISSNEINNYYLRMATSQKEVLFRFAKKIEEQYDFNSQSELFKELGKTIESIALDKTFGFNEIVKSKFKMVIEMLAFNHYIANLPHDLENKYLAELVTKHTRIQLMEINGIDIKEKLDDAYNCYMNYDQNITYDDFKNKFSKSLGFIPQEISINKIVYDFINTLTENDIIFSNYMKMVYDESQFLSHANGYMISSNTGSFMDYSSVIVFTDLAVGYIMELYCNITQLYNETEGEHKLNKFIYDIKKSLKDFKKHAKLKNEIDDKFKNLKQNYK